MVEEYNCASRASRALCGTSDASIDSLFYSDDSSTDWTNIEKGDGDLSGLLGNDVLPYMGDSKLRQVAASLSSDDLARCYVSSVSASKSTACEFAQNAQKIAGSSPPQTFVTTETEDKEASHSKTARFGRSDSGTSCSSKEVKFCFSGFDPCVFLSSLISKVFLFRLVRLLLLHRGLPLFEYLVRLGFLRLV